MRIITHGVVAVCVEDYELAQTHGLDLKTQQQLQRTFCRNDVDRPVAPATLQLFKQLAAFKLPLLSPLVVAQK